MPRKPNKPPESDPTITAPVIIDNRPDWAYDVPVDVPVDVNPDQNPDPDPDASPDQAPPFPGIGFPGGFNHTGQNDAHQVRNDNHLIRYTRTVYEHRDNKGKRTGTLIVKTNRRHNPPLFGG